MVNPLDRKPKTVLNKVPAQGVSAFHNDSDVDSSSAAQHHTLGAGAMQAAPGNHKHDKDYLKSTMPFVLGWFTAVQPVPHAFYTTLVNLGATVSNDKIPYLGSGEFRIDEAGWYRIECSFLFSISGAASNEGVACIFINNVVTKLGRSWFPNGVYVSCRVVQDVYLSVGDIVEFAAYQSNNLGAGHQAFGSPSTTDSYYLIRKIGD